MADVIERRHKTIIPDDPNYDVSADEWNDSMVVRGGTQNGEMMVRNTTMADGWSFASSFTGPVVVGDIVAGHIQGTSLDISGNSQFTGPAYFNGNPTGIVATNIQAMSLDVSGNAQIANATFTGNLVADHIQGQSLDIAGNATVNGVSYLLGGIQTTTLDVSGNAQIVNATFTGNLVAGHIQGTSLDISGNAQVNGVATLLGGVVANNIQATSLDVSGNAQIANATFTGDLVAGHLQGTSLDVSGNANLSGTTTMHDAVVNTTLTVQGIAYLNGGIQTTTIGATGVANFSAPIHLANNQPIAWRRVQNDADIPALVVDTFNTLQIGQQADGVTIAPTGPVNIGTGPSYGKLYAETAVAGTNNTQVATTAFVNARVTAMGGGTVTNSGGALAANQVVLGNGGADLKTLGSLGTATQVLHGNAAGAPTWGLVDIFTQVNGWETGPWTPTLVASQGSTGVGYTKNQGVYVKTGKFIVAYFDIQLYAKGTHTGAGLFIMGLPFPVSDTGGSFPYSAICRMDNMNPTASGGRPYIGVSAWSNPVTPTTIALWGQLPTDNPTYPPDQPNNTPNAILQSTDLTNTTKFAGTIFYFTA